MSSIFYKEDIIKEMSKEMNIPETEIEEIVNLNIAYIKKSIQEKDYVIINLPNLCKIRLNLRLAMSSYSYLKNLKTLRSINKTEQLRRQIKILTNSRRFNEKLLNYKNPLFERLYRKSARIKYIKYIYSKMFKIIKEVEIATNIIIEKIK